MAGGKEGQMGGAGYGGDAQQVGQQAGMTSGRGALLPPPPLPPLPTSPHVCLLPINPVRALKRPGAILHRGGYQAASVLIPEKGHNIPSANGLCDTLCGHPHPVDDSGDQGFSHPHTNTRLVLCCLQLNQAAASSSRKGFTL